jgi:hypothetical protein
MVRPRISPWSAPVLFAPKKDGAVMICIDYRALSKLVVKNLCPISLVDEVCVFIVNSVRKHGLALHFIIYEAMTEICRGLQLALVSARTSSFFCH